MTKEEIDKILIYNNQVPGRYRAKIRGQLVRYFVNEDGSGGILLDDDTILDTRLLLGDVYDILDSFRDFKYPESFDCREPEYLLLTGTIEKEIREGRYSDEEKERMKLWLKFL